jgi:hypothetical protein
LNEPGALGKVHAQALSASFSPKRPEGLKVSIKIKTKKAKMSEY